MPKTRNAVKGRQENAKLCPADANIVHVFIWNYHFTV